MNGRIYDPKLGRFLSVDPVFQFPTNTQSLNPYTYVLNAPLTLTDPTGLMAGIDLMQNIDGMISGGGMMPNPGSMFKAYDGPGTGNDSRTKTSTMSVAGAQVIEYAKDPSTIGGVSSRDKSTSNNKREDNKPKSDRKTGGTGRDRHEGKEGYRHIDAETLPGDPAVITIRNDNSKLADPDHAVKSTVADAIETVGPETGHDVNVNSTVRDGGDGAHPDGRAADMNRINKKPISDASTDPAVRAAVNDVVNSLKNQPGVNQVIGPTGGWNKSGNEWKAITDQELLNEHNNHIHFGVD
jgi:hypothetical protein